MPQCTLPSISQKCARQRAPQAAPPKQPDPAVNLAKIKQHPKQTTCTSTPNCMPPSTLPSISQMTFPSLLEVRTPIAFSYLGNKTKPNPTPTPKPNKSSGTASLDSQRCPNLGVPFLVRPMAESCANSGQPLMEANGISWSPMANLEAAVARQKLWSLSLANGTWARHKGMTLGGVPIGR